MNPRPALIRRLPCLGLLALVRDGRLFYESSTGRSAFFDYHEGDGKRILKTPDVELRAQ